MLRNRFHLLIFSIVLCGFEILSPAQPLPVILDTDIGDDIDDTWALALLLRCPELDVRLIVGDNGNAKYRAKLIAKLLEVSNRTDIPVGIGLAGKDEKGRQAKWVEDYDLASYRGTVHPDGVQAIIDTILGASGPITLIAIGPVPNLEEALQREPKIAEKAKFVGMHGSVRKGYEGSPEISKEYNVAVDVPACQAVFTAGWEMTITPLDTCGLVRLEGEKYAKVRDCKDPLAEALIENYRIWAADQGQPEMTKDKSSVLFDTVAVYLAFAEELVLMEELPIRVDDKGFTRIDPEGKKMRVATDWKDLGAFENFLVKRLTKDSRKDFKRD
jgi:inosine-uridine nucleoside N-ribohydrolase